MGLKLLAETSEQTFLSLVDINPTTIVFTLINTLLLFVLYRVFLHNKVMAMLEARREAINSEMNAAEQAQKDAAAVKTEYEQRLAESKEEAQKIVAEAVKRGGERESEIIANAENDARSIKARAEESIELEKRRALNEVKDQISEVVVLAASKVCEKEISEKDNAELIDSFLVNVGKES